MSLKSGDLIQVNRGCIQFKESIPFKLGKEYIPLTPESLAETEISDKREFYDRIEYEDRIISEKVDQDSKASISMTEAALALASLFQS